MLGECRFERNSDNQCKLADTLAIHENLKQWRAPKPSPGSVLGCGKMNFNLRPSTKQVPQNTRIDEEPGPFDDGDPPLTGLPCVP